MVDQPSDAAPPAASGDHLERGSPRWVTGVNKYALIGAWILLILVFGAIMPSTFLTFVNLQSILTSQAILLVLTLGLLPALAAGEYDLSAASVLGLSLVIVGYLNVLQDWPILPTIVVALSVGVLAGLINSALIVGLNVPSIVATLGVGTIATGTALGINIVAIGGIDPGLVAVMRTKLLGIQAVFFFGLALLMVAVYVFHFTPLGRYLYFIGAGRDVARLSGIRVDRIRVFALVTSSTVAALAGVMLAGVLGSADPTVGPTYLLPAFASAFLGATAIVPGRFNPLGAFIAVYFLVTGITGLQLLGLSGWVDQVFYGCSLIGAVVLARVFDRLAGRSRRVGT